MEIKVILLFCFTIWKISNGGVINHELLNFEISNEPNEYLTEADIIEVKELPLSGFDEITSQLYHTSIGGINGTNLIKNHIGCIFDLAYEYKYKLPADSNIQHFEYKTIQDTSEENILLYIDDMVSKMEICVDNGQNVVIHCVAGASRSGTILIAFLMKHENMSLKEAFILAKQRRPIVRPNNGFIKHLIDYEKKLGRKPSVKMVQEKRGNLVVEEPDFMRVVFPQSVDADFRKQFALKEQIPIKNVMKTQAPKNN